MSFLQGHKGLEGKIICRPLFWCFWLKFLVGQCSLLLYMQGNLGLLEFNFCIEIQIMNNVREYGNAAVNSVNIWCTINVFYNKLKYIKLFYNFHLSSYDAPSSLGAVEGIQILVSLDWKLSSNCRLQNIRRLFFIPNRSPKWLNRFNLMWKLFPSICANAEISWNLVSQNFLSEVRTWKKYQSVVSIPP